MEFDFLVQPQPTPSSRSPTIRRPFSDICLQRRSPLLLTVMRLCILQFALLLSQQSSGLTSSRTLLTSPFQYRSKGLFLSLSLQRAAPHAGYLLWRSTLLDSQSLPGASSCSSPIPSKNLRQSRASTGPALWPISSTPSRSGASPAAAPTFFHGGTSTRTLRSSARLAGKELL